MKLITMCTKAEAEYFKKYGSFPEGLKRERIISRAINRVIRKWRTI